MLKKIKKIIKGLGSEVNVGEPSYFVAVFRC